MTTNKYSIETNRVLAQKVWSKADVLFVMTQLRQLIENKGLQEKYKFLNLYCNWTVHTEISGSNTGYRILEYITDAFIAQNGDPENTMWINDAVIEGLSLHNLLDDIIKIGQGYNISTSSKFLNLDNWIPFASILLDILIEKPLCFPKVLNNKAKEIHDSIIAKANRSTGGDLNAVIGILFTRDKETDELLWEVNTIGSEKKQIHIVGQIAFINQKMVDDLKKKMNTKVKKV